jgi:pyruvate/2-oxoacid:ferredoxin oxidoreductase beta subunit
MALKLADYKTQVHNDWCPGCGDFGIVNAIQMALAEMGVRKLVVLEKLHILSILMVFIHYMDEF